MLFEMPNISRTNFKAFGELAKVCRHPDGGPAQLGCKPCVGLKAMTKSVVSVLAEDATCELPAKAGGNNMLNRQAAVLRTDDAYRAIPRDEQSCFLMH